LNRKLQLGFAYGQFKSEPMLKVWGSYRLSETLSIEGTFGQVQGVFSGTDFWHLNLVAEPWSDRRLSPFFGVGVGRFRNFPNLSLVDADTTRRQPRQRRHRRAVLPHRSLRAARRLLPLHGFRQRCEDQGIRGVERRHLLLLLGQARPQRRQRT
jgi:hypothetical protein